MKMRQIGTNSPILAVCSLLVLTQLSGPATGQIVPVDLEANNCGLDSYYNTAIYSCEKCGTNAERLDGKCSKSPTSSYAEE